MKKISELDAEKSNWKLKHYNLAESYKTPIEIGNYICNDL